MSQLRRERKQKAEESAQPRNWGKIAKYVVVILVVIGTAYYFDHRSAHKYDGFAQCLKDRGVKMYGAWWCPHCQEQKEKFGEMSFKRVPYTECGVPGDVKGQNPVCKQDGITHFPTWQFPPTGERVERVFTLEELSDRTGCPLP
jgi:hypothetical protein